MQIARATFHATGSPGCPRLRRAPHLALCLVLSLLWGLAAEAQDDPPPPGRVVLLLPLSGEFDHLGEQFLEALRLGLEECPALSWEVADSRGDPATARRQVLQIAADSTTLAIVGPVGTLESRSAAQAAESAGIPLLALTSEEGIERIGAQVFRLRVSPQEQARRIARIALDDLGLHRFAVLHPQDPFGTSAMVAFVQEVVASGGHITAIESYPDEETDFTLPIELMVNRRTRMLRGTPFSRPPAVSMRRLYETPQVDFEALFIPAYSEQVALILHFLAFHQVELGARVQLLGISSWAGAGLLLSPGLVAGALFTQIFHPAMDHPAALALLDRYRQAYGRTPTEAEVQAYDGITLLCSALSQLTSPSRATLRTALLTLEIENGSTGPLRFDRQGAIVRPIWLFAASHEGHVGPYTILR